MDYIDKLKRRKLNGFDNYIEQIRFPFFKKISRNQVINFDFPFTALVGPNGSGKSSVLQAMYGACRGKSVSDFWFSTNIDPIVESGSDINRFIYKFKPKGYHEAVEVLNKRTQRKQTAKQSADPDYWESARPAAKDGMAKMPAYNVKYKDIRNETRWRPVDKQVTYIDFRSEISAFDKSFYFGDFEARPTIKNKKDFLRYRSNALNGCIKAGIAPTTWHSRKLSSLRKLTDEELKWSNKILGKNYVSAQILVHNFFNQEGFSIIFAKNNQTYSEAVAGSGEVAVVTSVVRILKTPPHSLILLDEPEVSLHPGAQLSLRDLLLNKVSKDNCQVVISTHSESFLKDLPNNAIKLFYLDEANQTYSVAPEASSEQAFFRLGGIKDGQGKFLYVEDDLAKLMVEEAINEIDPNYPDDLQIIPHPGGAESIIKNLAVNFALTEPNQESQIVLLDGDKKLNVEIIKSDDIPRNQFGELDNILQAQTGIKASSYPIPLDGGNAAQEVREEQRNQLSLKVLDAYHKHFNFMNVDTPEELIWEISKNSETMTLLCQPIDDEGYKNKFKSLSMKMLGMDSANDIFTIQKMMLVARDRDHHYWIAFKELIKDLLNIAEIDQ